MKWQHLLLAGVFACCSVRGDVTNVSATVTADSYQQVVIRFDVPAPAQCTVQVFSDIARTIPVDDTNTGLFSGATACNRAGSIITGTHVQFVAGTRATEKASDNLQHSRSLAAATQYWYTVTDTLNVLAFAGTFTTSTIPLGNAAPEPMDFDATAFGNLATPSVNWTNQTVAYNDAKSGAVLKRFTSPADGGFMQAAQTFVLASDASGHWTNPANVTSASSATLATCDTAGTCTAANQLFVAAQPAVPSTITGGWWPSVVYIDFLARVFGSGTSATAGDRTVSLCWTTDSQTCTTLAVTVVLPQTTAAFAGTAPRSWSLQSPWSGVTSQAITDITVAAGTATIHFSAAPGILTGSTVVVNGITNATVSTWPGGNGLNGPHTVTISGNTATFATNAAAGVYTDPELTVSTGFPTPLWGSWSTLASQRPTHGLAGTRSGTLDCAAAVCTTAAAAGTQSEFDSDWLAGAKVKITGSNPTCPLNLCTIASVQHGRQITLVQNLTIAGAAWASANFGILVNKTTNSGAISVSVGYDFAFGASFDNALDGSGDQCNTVPITVSVDAAGNAITPQTGYMCMANAKNPTSQVQTLMYLFIPATGETRLISRGLMPGSDYRQWMGWGTASNVWYLQGFGSFFKAVYGGDYRTLTVGFPQSTTEFTTPEGTTITDMFAGSPIGTQIANCVAAGACSAPPPAFLGTSVGPPQGLPAINNGYMTVCAGGGAQDSGGYFGRVDISVTPARLVWLQTSYVWPASYLGIHACFATGSGRFAYESLNESPPNGTGGTFLGGPWNIPVQQVSKDGGSTFSTNTSIAAGDGADCPAGLPAWIQALGCKPVASGGTAGQFLVFRVQGDACNPNAAAAESAALPCPYNASWSSVKALEVGDTIHDKVAADLTFGERMLVVSVAGTWSGGPATGKVLGIYRYSHVPASSGFVCGTASAPGEYTHADAWQAQGGGYRSCYGANYWSDSLDPTFAWAVDQSGIGTHSDFGQGALAGLYTTVGGAYSSRPNQAMPAQITQPASTIINGSPTYGAVSIGAGYLQSYPSKRQILSLAGAGSNMNTVIDTRAYLPAPGVGGETAQGLLGNAATLVGGTARTWLVTMSGDTPDVKRLGFVAWAAYHMLQDMSGPASSIGDANLWKFCYVLNAGECRGGSIVGQLYAVVPQEYAAAQCLTNYYALQSVCIGVNNPYGGWVAEWDVSSADATGRNGRRLTTAFNAPGRQYDFSNSRMTPDASWVAVQSTWTEGQASGLWWVKRPPLAVDALDRTQYINTPLSIPAGAVGDSVRVCWGYAENAPNHDPAGGLWPMQRAEEGCSDDTGAQPFLWHGETQHWTNNSAVPATVNMKLIAGRVAYYRVDKLNGGVTTLGTLQIFGTPAPSPPAASNGCEVF